MPRTLTTSAAATLLGFFTAFWAPVGYGVESVATLAEPAPAEPAEPLPGEEADDEPSVHDGSQLYIIRPDGSQFTQLTHHEDRRHGSPEWSPDGKQIAVDWWLAHDDIPNVNMAIFTAEGEEVRQLGHGAMPSWSPDGTQIVCHTYTPSAIVVVNADGTGRETLVERWGSPRWSPLGDRIANLGLSDTISHFHLADGRQTLLFRGPYSPKFNFSISNDGLRYCFSDYSGGLAVATLDPKTGKAQVRRQFREGECHKSSWSPDGKRVVFAMGGGDEPMLLYLLEVDSGKPPVRLAGQTTKRGYFDPDWSPDGQWIAFVSNEPPKP